MNKSIGTFVISLDLELYWGMRDVVSLSEYQIYLEGVRQAVPAILELLQKYQVKATWATVGFLYYANLQELQSAQPELLPNYSNQDLSPYRYLQEASALESELHFCPDLIKLIKSYSGQEIGSHTFSHYYCLEPGQTQAEFRADLERAIAVADKIGSSTKSLVFPRNQYNQNYLSTIADLGIDSYRGNPPSSIYNSEAGDGDRLLKKMLRFLDTYINLTGENCYSWSEIGAKYPINVPSSRFLRPYSSKLRFLDKLRLRRITSGLKYAARNNQVYHLWWHPHNFGVNLEENLYFLEKILLEYQKLAASSSIQSLTMAEVAEFSLRTNKISVGILE